MSKEQMTHKILATPVGYRVENYRGTTMMSSERTRTYLGAKWYIWKYDRRLKKVGDFHAN